jgi:GNAT superfamily N-acetyltransferase
MALSDPALASESPLLETDLAGAEALLREAGWNQVAADWGVFLDLGTVYAVRTGAGRLVATAATLPYDGGFAWISMVLVAQAYRRQGLATRLLRRCIADLTRAGLVPILDATPAGRAVYSRLGFVDSWGFHRLISRGTRAALKADAAPQDVAVGAVTDTSWPALCAYDETAFGADRSALLANLRSRRPDAAFVAMRGKSLVGFVLARDGRVASQIGPLVADSEAVARALLTRALNAVAGPVYIDIADAKAGMRDWLERLTFTVERPFTRMLYRSGARFGDLARTYAVVGPEFG